MKRTAALALTLVVGVATYVHEPCRQYPTKITSLDNKTCLPEFFSGWVEDFYIERHGDNKCTPTVTAYTNCRCKNGDGVSGNHYCVYNVSRTPDDNTANVTLGLCSIGAKCFIYDFNASMEVDLRDGQLARRLNIFPRPPCIAPDLEITENLRVAAGCEFFCYGRNNKDINDGRVCALEWYSADGTGKPVVTLTGSCDNGMCRSSGVYREPVAGMCHDRSRYEHSGKLVKECTYSCPNGSIAVRPDGLTCLFRKTKVTKRNVVGVCKKGTCTEIRKEDACAVDVHHHLNTSPITVAKKCMCRGKPVINGTLCALSHKWGIGGNLLKEVGICLQGACNRRPPDRPPEHAFKKKECNVMDVKVTPELIVAAACKVTCRRYVTEARPDGTLCLLQYRRDKYNAIRKKTTLHIGECNKGECRYSNNSFEISI